MDYSALDLSEQRQILENRIKQYEAQHFEATLNLGALKATEPGSVEIPAIEERVAGLEKALAHHRATLRDHGEQG